MTKARILTDCHLGGRMYRCDEVAELADEALKEGQEQGWADPAPAAVAYAESLVVEG